MSAWTTILVLGFSTPSIISLILSWRTWMKGRTSERDWRAGLLTVGLVLVCQVLAAAFLLSGLRPNEQSFAQRVFNPMGGAELDYLPQLDARCCDGRSGKGKIPAANLGRSYPSHIMDGHYHGLLLLRERRVIQSCQSTNTFAMIVRRVMSAS
jgi:hypothetical protein